MVLVLSFSGVKLWKKLWKAVCTFSYQPGWPCLVDHVAIGLRRLRQGVADMADEPALCVARHLQLIVAEVEALDLGLLGEGLRRGRGGFFVLVLHGAGSCCWARMAYSTA